MLIQPAWVADLLSIAAADEWSGLQHELGFGEVCPMWRRMIADVAQAEDAGGYSSMELVACKAAVSWLAAEHPDEYEALVYETMSWKRRHLQRHDEHEQLVTLASQRIAEFVDRHCG